MNNLNNCKVQIGINYKPKPYVETDPDMMLLQKSLISKPKASWLSKLLGCFNRA